VRVTFQTGFPASNRFTYAGDFATNLNSGWQDLGTWTVGVPLLSVATVSPPKGQQR
jgi:hypothetical protein